jgi:hypothetical protein
VAGLFGHATFASIQGTDFARKSALGIQGTDANLIASSDFATIGPVEAFDIRRSTITVLGQQYVLGNGARRAFLVLAIGDYVAVSGMLAADGSVVANGLSKLPSMYVSGASFVYLKGKVLSNDTHLGQIVVGTLSIDYTAAPTALDVNALGVGSTLELAGTQPLSSGVMLASTANVISVNSISGTDSRSISGTDSRSISGTDSLSISGTDAQSISGTDSRSISGTDSRSISGTDSRSIAGTDAQSISGTDF